MKKFYYFLFSGLLLSSCASSEWAFDDTYEKTKNPMAYNFDNRNDVREFVKKEEQRYNVVFSYDFQTGSDNIENQYYLNEQFQYYNFQPYLANRNDCYCVYDGTYSRNYNAFGITDSYKLTYNNKFYGYSVPFYGMLGRCSPFYNSFYTFGTRIRSNIDGEVFRDNFLFAHNFNHEDMAYWHYVHTKDYNIKDDEKPNGNGGGIGNSDIKNNGYEFEIKRPLMSQIGFNHPDFVLMNIDFDNNSNNGSSATSQNSLDTKTSGSTELATTNNYNSNENKIATNPFSINNPYPGSGIAGNYNVSNNPYDKQNGNYNDQTVTTTSNSAATANSRSTSTSRRTSNHNNTAQNGGHNNTNNGNVYSNKVGNSTYSPNNTFNNGNYGGGGGAPRSSSGNYSSGGGGTGSNRGNSGGSGRR